VFKRRILQFIYVPGLGHVLTLHPPLFITIAPLLGRVKLRLNTTEEYMTVKAIPDGYHAISPALTCRNASQAIDFYKKVFGAKEIMRMGEPGGIVMHAELQIGDSKIFLNDEIPGMASAPVPGSGNPIYLFLYSEDVDRVFESAVAAGSKVAMPLENQFWGDRYGKIVDPYGHMWGLAQHVEDVEPEEMERRSAAYKNKASQAKSAT
jgi:PhnB protein